MSGLVREGKLDIVDRPLRVVAVGVTEEETEELRQHVSCGAGLEIVGTHALQAGSSAAPWPPPAPFDALVLSRLAAARWDLRTHGTGERSASKSADTLVEPLTRRELAVLALVSDGLGNRAIAEALGISEHTVKFHLAAVFGKLGVSNRTKAIQRGLQLGLIEI